MQDKKPLAILAGNGKLPQILIDSCIKKDQKFVLFLLAGQTYDIDYSYYDPVIVNYGEIEKFLTVIKQNKIQDVVFIGGVTKPNFSKIKVDKKGAVLLGKILANKILGDDAVLKTVIKYFQKQGLNIVAIDSVLDCVVSKKGPLTNIMPTKEQLEDIHVGKQAILAFSKFDVGQSLVVAQKQIIAVEAVEGTSKMIARVGDLGVDYKDKAILVKMKKKGQSKQADLPTIGLNTIDSCKKSQIKGIAIQAKSTIIIEKEKVINAAESSGIFIYVI
ncbi:MAG: UDP-2,3-diacylglucosamine diphosphatase LpxI [Rickettsiales bacterium]|nr:UDP-2,3-diacylglucosamine diphosphatase LpxI [Rickettsiales bacterium]